ncbi:hypothetical protein CEXT_93321 [Caerostris extrusa]|uniref:Uncharacterized protein n=1 Tax=Caerostris extrusa TaxID=172846 RepID=A0AAV4XRB1_CAEEX|nr:hypothetical protein CEXT_93321 [Caerostris extrusa]
MSHYYIQRRFESLNNAGSKMFSYRGRENRRPQKRKDIMKSYGYQEFESFVHEYDCSMERTPLREPLAETSKAYITESTHHWMSLHVQVTSSLPFATP